MDTQLLTEILEETAQITAQTARGLRPAGPPMSDRATIRAIQEHVNNINRLLGQMRTDVERRKDK